MKKDSNKRKTNQHLELQLLVLLGCPKYIILPTYNLSQSTSRIMDLSQNKFLELFSWGSYLGIREWCGSKSKRVRWRNKCYSIKIWRLIKTLLANIRLTLWRSLIRLLLHYVIQDLRTLSLPITLLLTVVAFTHANLRVRFVFIVGRWSRRHCQNKYMRCGEKSFSCLIVKVYLLS